MSRLPVCHSQTLYLQHTNRNPISLLLTKQTMNSPSCCPHCRHAMALSSTKHMSDPSDTHTNNIRNNKTDTLGVLQNKTIFDFIFQVPWLEQYNKNKTTRAKHNAVIAAASSALRTTHQIAHSCSMLDIIQRNNPCITVCLLHGGAAGSYFQYIHWNFKCMGCSQPHNLRSYWTEFGSYCQFSK